MDGGIDGRGIVMEVEGAWNLGGMGILSCIRVRIGVLVCVMVLVVVVVLVWMWMVLTVWVVVGGVGGAVGDGCDDNGRDVGGSWLCGGCI